MVSVTRFVILWSVIAAQLSGQTPDTALHVLSVRQAAYAATSDHLSNTYLLTNASAVEKYDSTGKLAARYSNKRLGLPAFVDCSNPLKLLVWYADFQTAVFLDRNLTELGRLNVAEAGFPAVRCVASAADGNLWAYDEGTAQLLKLRPNGEKMLESHPLNLAFAQPFSPTCARDDAGQVIYLSDPNQGIAVFDPFAQWLKLLPIKQVRFFEVGKGLLYRKEGGALVIEEMRGLFGRKVALPDNGTARSEGAVHFSRHHLFLLRSDAVEVYKIK
jgi:hypothetical protein